MADVNGTNGNDALFFQGSLQTLTFSFVSPYSGESYFIDEDMNVNTASYEGLAGIDTLFMTNLGDALFLRNHVTGEQMVWNVERFTAGHGGDVIHLADTEYILGDITIEGGAGNDILLGNSGDDTINGRDGNDIIEGGPGSDLLSGGAGNDTISGGTGADYLRGEADNDVLKFSVDGAFTADYLAFNIGSPGVAGTEEYVLVEGSNLSLDVFDGGAGFDTLAMTGGDDTFFLDDPFHDFHANAMSLRLASVEQIDAGAGNDVIDLTHDTLAYGSITINGGDGDDHLWSSSGNDVLNGGNGGDHLAGGFGHDQLNGDDGDDSLYGGLGNDTLRGGAGNDIIYGGASSDSEYAVIIGDKHQFNNTVIFPNLQETVSILDLVPPGDNALGIAAGDLSVDFSTTAQIEFLSTGAGYNNSLGFYNIGQDGTIYGVNLAFPNVKDFETGDSATINLPGTPDTDFGFFIISDGARKNDFSDLDLENGTLSFVYMRNSAHERPATIYDPADKVWLVYDDGTQETFLKAFNGPHGIYHTTLRGGETNLNHDGEVHVVSGIMEGTDGSTLRIGFEDLKHTGDADYNDVVFDLTVQSDQQVVLLEDDTDTLIGGAGDDYMNGGIGNDILLGGEGADTLYGDQGADIFLFQTIADAGDIITDFEQGEDGDAVNITDLLDGFDENSSAIDDFLQLVDNDGATALQVNTDGQGTDFVTVVTFDGGLGGAGLADLLADGNIVTDQSVSV